MFCLRKEYAVPIYGHFSVQGLFSFISESKQLLFECSDLLHNFTTAPECFAVGITEKVLWETETCRNQIVLQQLRANKETIAGSNLYCKHFCFFSYCLQTSLFTAKIYFLGKDILEYMDK